MREKLGRDALEVRQLNRPLQILAQEFAWEKEHNEYTGKENPHAFENFAKLWCAIRERSALFQENAYEPLECLECNNALRMIVKARITVTNKLNRISELLIDGRNVRGLNARVAEAAEIASVLCSDDLPFLMDSLRDALQHLGHK